jgi:hypothetical protein
MNDLVRFAGPGFLQTRAERQTSRALERVRTTQALVTAQEVARLEIVQDVTEAALMSASQVAAVEALLTTRTPHAAGRLNAIAEAGTLGMADVVLRASRRCR